MSNYPSLEIDRKTGDESFHTEGMPLKHNLLSFWQWSSSDLTGNTMRGVLAEYIVASALDAVSGHREEWDAYDILTKEGIKVEIKSAAYIQSWTQEKLSAIQFGIRETLGRDSKSNTSGTTIKRQADVYVFCVLAHTDQSTIDPLDMSQWQFYIMSTESLNYSVGAQKTIGLPSLLRLNPIEATYETLASSIKIAVNI